MTSWEPQAAVGPVALFFAGVFLLFIHMFLGSLTGIAVSYSYLHVSQKAEPQVKLVVSHMLWAFLQQRFGHCKKVLPRSKYLTN